MLKRSAILFILTLFLYFSVIAQSTNTINRLAKQLELTRDTALKIQLLDSLAILTNETDAKVSLQYSRQQLALATQSNDTKGVHKAYYNLANIIASEGKRDSAVYFAKQARQYFLRTNESLLAVKSTYLMMIFLSLMGQQNEATSLALTNIAYADALDNPHLKGITATAMGILYNQIERPNDALIWFDKALKQLELQQDAVWEGRAYFNIGVSYRLLDKDSLAIVAFKQALAIFEPLNLARQTVICLNAFGEIHSEHAESKQAITYYEQAIELCKATNQKNMLSMIYLHCAADYTAIKQYDKAEAMYEAALPMIEMMPTFEKIKFYESLSILKLKQGNPTEALRYMTIVRKLETQKFTDNNNETDALIKKHAVEKQEQENALLQARNNLYVGGMIGLLVLLSASAWAYWRLRQQKAIIEQQKQTLVTINRTKDKLFALISHDLISPVDTLKNYTILMDWGAMNQEKFAEALQGFKLTLNNTSNMLENVLHWAITQMTELKPRQETVNISTIVVEQIDLVTPVAKDKTIDIKQAIPTDLILTIDKNHFALIIRNLLQNALKFTNIGGSIVFNSETTEGGKKIITISDNGVGMTPEVMSQLFKLNDTHQKGTANKGGTGLGLILTKELVELNGGSLSVASEVGVGTRFSMTF